ncbi:hypothetical protein [Erysipelothrix larvae]|nr:hypothetical protein [Erysipelothrix larvae]
MDDQLIQLGITFADVVSSNTISFVSTKMETAKQKKILRINPLHIGNS